MEMIEKELVERHFMEAINREMLRFVWVEWYKKNDGTNEIWLTVEYRDVKTYSPKTEEDYAWRLVCGQDVGHMARDNVIARIILMLTDRLIGFSQDVNGIWQEYTLTKRSFIP